MVEFNGKFQSMKSKICISKFRQDLFVVQETYTCTGKQTFVIQVGFPTFGFEKQFVFMISK